MVQSILSVSGAKRAAFLAFSGPERGRAVLATWSLPHAVLNITFVKTERELGQAKEAAVVLFHIGHIYLWTTQKSYMFKENGVYYLFFSLGAKREWGSHHFHLLCFKLFISMNFEWPFLRWPRYECEVALDDLQSFPNLLCQLQQVCCYFGFFMTPHYLEIQTLYDHFLSSLMSLINLKME